MSDDPVAIADRAKRGPKVLEGERDDVVQYRCVRQPTVMVAHLRSSMLISGLLPVAVLMCFVAMSRFGVDSNIMSLTGIAIAIGTMVDMGIVMTENIYRGLVDDKGKRPRGEVVEEAPVWLGAEATVPLVLS